MSYSNLSDVSAKKRWLGFFEFTYSPLRGQTSFTLDGSYYKVYLPSIFDVTAVKDQTLTVPFSTSDLTEVFTFPSDYDEWYRLGDYIYFHSTVEDRVIIFCRLNFTDGNDFKWYENPADSNTDQIIYHSLISNKLSVEIGSANVVYGIVTSSVGNLSVNLNDQTRILMHKEISLYNKAVQIYMHVDESSSADRLFHGFISRATFSKDAIRISVNDWTKSLDKLATWELESEYLTHQNDGVYVTSAYSNDVGLRRFFSIGRHSIAGLIYDYSTTKSIDTYNGIDNQSIELKVSDYTVETSADTSTNRTWAGIATFGDGGSLHASITTATYSISGFDKRINVPNNRIFADGDIIRVVISAVTYYDRVIKVSTANTTRLHVAGGLDGVIPYPSSPTTFTVDIEELAIAIENSDGYLQQISPTYYSYYTSSITTSKGVDVALYGVTFTSGLEAAYTTLFGSDPYLTAENFSVYARIRPSSSYYDVADVLERILTQNSLTLDSTALSNWESYLSGARIVHQYELAGGTTYLNLFQQICNSTYSLGYITRGANLRVAMKALWESRTSSFVLTDPDILAVTCTHNGDSRTSQFTYENKTVIDHAHLIGTKWGSSSYTSYKADAKLTWDDSNTNLIFTHILENIDSIADLFESILQKRVMLYSFSVGNMGLNFEIGECFEYRGKLISPDETGRLLTIVGLNYNIDKVEVVAVDLYGNAGEDGW